MGKEIKHHSIIDKHARPKSEYHDIEQLLNQPVSWTAMNNQRDYGSAKTTINAAKRLALTANPVERSIFVPATYEIPDLTLPMTAFDE